MKKVSPCPNCGKDKLYKSREVSSGGGHAPNYLPGLGGFFRRGKFTLVACAGCGLVRFFAREDALEGLEESSAWTRI